MHCGALLAVGVWYIVFFWCDVLFSFIYDPGTKCSYLSYKNEVHCKAVDVIYCFLSFLILEQSIAPAPLFIVYPVLKYLVMMALNI